MQAGNPGYHQKVTDGLPRGIIEQTSDLYFRTLGGDPVQEVYFLQYLSFLVYYVLYSVRYETH